MREAYAELMREMDSPHVRKTPSRSFVAVLRELVRLEERDRYAWTIARHAEIDPATATRVLHRMVRLGLADRWTEPGAAWELGRRPRTYYRLTPAGETLAQRITAGAS